MHKVNNKKTIHLLTKSSFIANKMRNIFAVVAIILTTVLFTGLFTVASSLLASMEESTMRQVGGNSHGSFKYLTMEQYDKLKTHPGIKSISYSVVLGIAENKNLAKRPSEIRYVNDEIGAKGMFSMPTTGRLPQSDDELAADTIVLKYLGIPAELGQKVTLEYSLNGEKRSGTFTLAGFWQGDKLMLASQIWLNRGYVEKQLEGYVPANENDTIGSFNADVNFSNSFQIESKMKKVISDSGYSPDEIAYGVNWAYAGNSGSVDAGTIAGVACAILMIVFCGYLIISNVFYISIAKDIRFYGLLKTVGTTGRQIRVLIRRQALALCLIGIPLGLFCGYFVGVLLTPTVLSILNTNIIKISISPIAFIVSAFFTIITVLISIQKPSKISAKVSPVEALRSTDGAQKTKKSAKKSGGIKLCSMASGNVFRNRKKAFLVTASLSLSLIILNSAYSIASSFDMDKYLSSRIGSDFAIGDVSNFNIYIDYRSPDTLSQEFLTGLASKNGIEKMSNIYFSEPYGATDPRLADLPERAAKELNIGEQQLATMKDEIQDPLQLQHIYGIDEAAWNRLVIHDGEINQEKLKTGKYVVAGPYDTNGRVNFYNVGEKVEITNADGVSREYEVLAIASIPRSISVKHYHPIMPEFFLPGDVFLQDIEQKAPMLTTLDVADADEARMEAYLRDYCENTNPNMQYASKATYAAEYENTQRIYKSVGLILSLLVAFIGIMNFINTVVTSIISRKREFAMLQSIGMTNRQTQTMLICEGLVYTALTAVFALTAGSALGYLTIGAITEGGTYISLHFTIIPSLLCLPVLAAVSVLVPYISERSMSRDSIVERLRDVE